MGDAFCLPMSAGEFRILLNYQPSFAWVRTLAHELGHAYHLSRLASHPWTQRHGLWGGSAALGETASLFCEMLVTAASLEGTDEADLLHLVDENLRTTVWTLDGNHALFLFEQRLLDARASRELSVKEISDLAVEAQRDVFGDALEPEALDPYVWAKFPSFFSPEDAFPHWPYTFALLLGQGLYVRYRENLGRFRRVYDDLLSRTGIEDAATLAGRFGIDLSSTAFWHSSLDICRERIHHFEELAARIGCGIRASAARSRPD